MGIDLQTVDRAMLAALNPKLAFFDVDGTLLGKNFTIHPAVLEEISRLRESGVAIALATGRSGFAAEPIIQQIGANFPCMLQSGSQIWDPLEKKSIFTAALRISTLENLREIARQRRVTIEYYTLDGYFVEVDSPLTKIHAAYTGRHPQVQDWDQIRAEAEILRVIFDVDQPQLIDQLRQDLALIPEVKIGIGFGANHPELTFINVTDERGSRDKALDLLTARLGISDREVISFGDAEADIPFLKRAGFGVAMGNASETVKQAARYVTASVEDAGVAVALKILRSGTRS